MAAFLDVCRFNPTLAGTTDWTYSSAVTGYQGPAAAGAVNGAVYRYRAESADLSQWEIGYGAYNSGTGVFARTAVLYNSLGTTAKVDFSAAPQVAIVALAEDLVKVALPQNRLSLTSGTAITTSDVAGATSVFLSAGQSIISDGSNIVSVMAAELSMALDSTATDAGYHQSAKNFDVFEINDGGTLRIGTGPAWTSDIARGSGAGTTEIHPFGNTAIWTNANSVTIRFGSASDNTVTVAADQAVYLGSFRTTAAGQTEDSRVKRFLYNLYNPAWRALVRNDTTISWTLAKSATPGTTGYSQAHSNTANKVEVLAGLAGGGINLNVLGTFSAVNGGEFLVGVGLGSTTTSLHTQSAESYCAAGARSASTATYEGYLALGYQAFNWLEQNFSDAGATPVSYGTSIDARIKDGLVGRVWQ